MFTITTAQPGDAWHVLHPFQRLGHTVPTAGFEFELEIAVRRDPANPRGEFEFKFWAVSSFTGFRWELITNQELDQRRARAWIESGKSYDASCVAVISESSAIYQHCIKLRDHFLKVMEMKLFALPINV